MKPVSLFDRARKSATDGIWATSDLSSVSTDGGVPSPMTSASFRCQGDGKRRTGFQPILRTGGKGEHERDPFTANRVEK